MSGEFFDRLAARAVRADSGLRPAIGEADLLASRTLDADEEATASDASSAVVIEPTPQDGPPPPAIVVEIGAQPAPRPRQEIDAIVAAPSPVPEPPDRVPPERSSPIAPVLVEHTSHRPVEPHENPIVERQVHESAERSERIVERVVDLRPMPSAAAATAVDPMPAVGPAPASEAPRIEIHIGRLKIDDNWRRPPTEPDGRGRPPDAPATPALGLSEYLAARNSR